MLISHDHVWYVRGYFLYLARVIFISVQIAIRSDGPRALGYQDRDYNDKAYHRPL